MPYISFSCLIALARTSSSMLNRSSENEHSCLFPDCRRKAFSLSLLSMMLSVGLSYMAFIMLNYVLSAPNFLSFIVKRCWILSNAFPASIEMLISFYLLFCYVVHHIYWLAYVEPSLHPRDKSHLIMVHDPFNVLQNLIC